MPAISVYNMKGDEMKTELIKILEYHLEKYPLMRAQDIYKLVYQHEFGCAHAVADRERAGAWLAEELKTVVQSDGPLFEDIGNGFVRVRLSALDANGVSPDEVLDWFVRSAMPAGDKAEFAEIMRELPACGLPIDALELTAFVDSMEKEGFPAAHHSEIYRELYRPAYRVVMEKYAAKRHE